MVGSFAHLDSFIEAIYTIRAEGFDQFEIFSPVLHEDLQAFMGEKKSPVRISTLVGALAGLIGAGLLTALSVLIWNMVVGGKPIVSIPAFMVPGFELTILFAAVATFLAVFYFAGLPGKLSAGYHPRFSNDCFGIYVKTSQQQQAQIKMLLEKKKAQSCWLVPQEETPSR